MTLEEAMSLAFSHRESPVGPKRPTMTFYMGEAGMVLAAEAKRIAMHRGESLSSILREALALYIAKYGGDRHHDLDDIPGVSE